MAKPIRSPHNRSYVTTGEKLSNGRKLAYLSNRWMEANEQSFRTIYAYVKGMQAKSHGGRVRDRVAAFCVDHGIEVGDGEYTFSNTYWAGIARYLVLYDKTLLDAPIRLNDSDIDCYGLLPVSYLPELEDYEYEDVSL